jgi:hypothetical protein
MGTPSNFAEYEAAGSTYNPPPEEPPPAPEPEPEPESEPEVEEPPPEPVSKKKLSAAEEHQRLIKRITDARKELRELEARKTRVTAVPDDEEPPVMPSLSGSSDTLEEWEKKMHEFYQKQMGHVIKQFKRDQAEEAAKAQQQRMMEDYNSKVEAHIKTHPNFVEGLKALPELPPLMVQFCYQKGPELAQKLVDDPDETRRIMNLPADQQVFEMGILAATLNGKAPVPEPEAEPVKVPAKLGATSGGPSPQSKPNFGARSFAEYEKLATRYAQPRPGFVTRTSR